jgi:hypothetical protein
MPFDFPSSPTNGQQVTTPGGTYSWDGTKWVAYGATPGVASWNTRTGPVTMNSGDVTTALTFTPYSATNPSGYQTAPNVIAALAGGNPGAFSTLAASAAITPAQVAGLVGTTTNNNAQAGSVGEYISSTVLIGAALALTSTTARDVTSISLTAGDWDVWGTVCFAPSAATITNLRGWINTTSVTNPTEPGGGGMVTLNLPFPSSAQVIPVGRLRLSLATTTSAFLSVNSAFSAGTLSAYGFIGARRVR